MTFYINGLYQQIARKKNCSRADCALCTNLKSNEMCVSNNSMLNLYRINTYTICKTLNMFRIAMFHVLADSDSLTQFHAVCIEMISLSKINRIINLFLELK